GISAGRIHACALQTTGITCWGRDADGEIGNGINGVTPPAIEPPTKVTAPGGLAFNEVSAGAMHTCGRAGMDAYCWGNNSHGEVGDGTTSDQHMPTLVANLMGQSPTLVVGYTHSCATTSSGAFCWGDNAFGQLGDGTTMQSTVPITQKPAFGPGAT